MADNTKTSSLPIIVVSLLWYYTFVAQVVSLSTVRWSDDLADYKAYIGALLFVLTLVFLQTYGRWKRNDVK